jgi:FkbM family methyltransferase
MIARGIKDFVKWSAGAFGIDVRSAKHTEASILRSMLRRTNPKVVLDVGANAGQYARRVRATGYNGVIVSFEPLADAHRRLAEAARGDANWLVAPRTALGSQSATAQIHVAADNVSSSVLPMTSLLQETAPRVTCIAQQSTAVARLDAFSDLIPAGDLYLKVDAQGYELEVLRGATGLVPRIGAMQLELSLIPLYEGAPSLVDVVAHAQALGYELFQLVPTFRDDRNGRLLQAEGFFVRSTLHASA